MFSFVVEGIAIICTADGGQLYHAKQRREWVDFSQAAISTSVIIGLLFAPLFLVFPRFFILIFTNQADVITSCLSVLWLIALFQPLNGSYSLLTVFFLVVIILSNWPGMFGGFIVFALLSCCKQLRKSLRPTDSRVACKWV